MDGFSFLEEPIVPFDFFAADFNAVPADFGFAANVFLARDFGFDDGGVRILVLGLTAVFLAGFTFVVPPVFFSLWLASFFFAGFCFFEAVKVGSKGADKNLRQSPLFMKTSMLYGTPHF